MRIRCTASASFFLSLPFLSSAAQARSATDPIRDLDAYAAKAVAEWRVPGLAIAVVKDGRIVFAKGYGVREAGKVAPVDTQTLFAIGSTTKAMTAASIGMLVDEGKLRWDDRVTKILPSFQLADPYVTREITIRDLLTHRAGLGNADVLWYRTDNSPEEVVRRVRFADPAYSLRSSFIYQNVMYAVAGQVVAAASGMPWEQFVRTRIFGPVGMPNTVPLLDSARRRSNVASPHYRLGDTIRVVTNASVDAVAPAGAVWASVADMARWTRFVLDSARVDGRRLLKPESYAEWLKPETMVTPEEFYPTARLTKPHWRTYAFGWFQEDYSGRMVDFHTGSIDGMVAIIGLIPDERLGVYVLANLDHAEVRHALMYRVFDAYLGNPPRDWSADLLRLYGGMRAAADSARSRAEARRIPNTRPSLPLDQYAGTYADSLVGEVTVTLDKGKLRLRASSTHAGTLEHWEYDTFRLRWDNTWEGSDYATFTIGRDGSPSRLDLEGAMLRRVDRQRASAQR
ncbi:MAG: serine hydrolase [Acidobacteria bacterium]|jgi:CubicO group peptidase (beta-lactamase class C family)|nr:serine hydrolase [Acidobacteriota bacterium]